MARKLIKKLFPKLDDLHKDKSMGIFGELKNDPNLWHLNRRSVSSAFAVGLFSAFIPIPFQMVLAGGLAIAVRCNLPIAVLLVWITNPVTMPPVFYLAYKIGTWILRTPQHEFHFDPSLHWLFTELTYRWQPFLLGCFILAACSALAGYISVRLCWRYYVVGILRTRILRKLRKLEH